LQNSEVEAAKVANPAKESESRSKNLASLASLAGPKSENATVTPLEMDSEYG